MPFPPPLPVVDVISALRTLGFVDAPPVAGEKRLTHNVGTLKLEAMTHTNLILQRGVLVSGFYSTQRETHSINFELPEKVESALQVAAWLAYGVGDSFQPARHIEWLEWGRENQELLPWRRQVLAYENRPQISIARPWMRLARDELKLAASKAGPDDLCHVTFDGTMLIFRYLGKVIPLRCTGNRPWDSEIAVRLASFGRLPSRWNDDPVQVAIWENNLVFGGCRLEIQS